MHFALLASGKSGCGLMTLWESADCHGMNVEEGGKKGMEGKSDGKLGTRNGQRTCCVSKETFSL